MKITDFMSRDRGDGCRGARRNAARLSYRLANSAAFAMNVAACQPAPAKSEKPPRRFAFGPFHVETGSVTMKAEQVTGADVKEAVTRLHADDVPVANFADEKASRERAAKDRKNEAARARRAAAKLAVAA